MNRRKIMTPFTKKKNLNKKIAQYKRFDCFFIIKRLMKNVFLYEVDP